MNDKPIKTWEKIVVVLLEVIGLMLFHDTGRIEALVVVVVLLLVTYAKIQAWGGQS